MLEIDARDSDVPACCTASVVGAWISVRFLRIVLRPVYPWQVLESA